MYLNISVNEFILLGLTKDVLKEDIVFAIFLLLYLTTVFANLLTVMTIRYSRMLGSPMYFFLFYLSFADACFSTSTAPRLIINAVSEKKVISYNECMIQIFTLHFFGCMEIFVLILMSFDRYVAICKPLRYTTIMSTHVCGALVKLAWVGSFIHSIAQVSLALKLPFCGPNVIDHFFCDMQPLLKLACMDTYVMNLLIVFNSGAICTVGFIILIISYILILHSLSNHTTEGRKKALSTCTSHIIVVILFFVPCIYTYARPLTVYPVDKIVAVFYTIGTPMLNPLIYTLRNAEIKNAMRKLWCTKLG
ncbi:olfactory receptor 4C11-like [Dasypus novemcinctus]|uniref:olfactory receptor 4C11-like n=1 Tax=Dasypus novemcinctus TaxID=9361 RepID=UPI00062A701E|nr:olfactory receptor 4C11-like [Dasypus novemcinctus]